MAAPVIINEYDPAWPAVFARLAAIVATPLGGLALAIEHIGSTAVPGLAAKPIIDIDIAVADDAAVREAIARLATIGYVHEGDLGIPGREAFAAPTWLPTHHLYVCRADNREYRRHIAFRDYLRAHPDAVRDYAALKRQLALKHRDDRDAYTNAKSEFIAGILALAGWRH